MVKFCIFLTLCLVLPVMVLAVESQARIDMGVSPLKYDVTVFPGKSTTKAITFFNNSNTPYTIYLTAEDCTAERSGTPECRAPRGTGVDINSIATWVTFEGAERFIVPPKSERKINFTITPPPGAVPGGHYGAVFLNNLDESSESGNAVKMIRRAGVLLLANIPGNLVYDTEVGEVQIDMPFFSAPTDPDKKPAWKIWTEKILTELDPRFDPPMLLDDGDFVMTFTVPVKNSGNIHVLPVGRIELFDENGVLLKRIGKETIRTPEGVFFGEKIVDYLPINDETSNVLPNSSRIFTVNWRGFAYISKESGEEVIKFLSPQDYYSQQAIQKSQVLMPWEKYRVQLVTKNLTAKILLEYKGENGQLVPYEKEQQVSVKYYSLVKGINWGAILILLGVLFVIWIFIRIQNREKRMEKLEEEVEYLEEEIDELEKGRVMAKKALEKKATKKPAPKKSPEKKSTSRKTPPKE